MAASLALSSTSSKPVEMEIEPLKFSQQFSLFNLFFPNHLTSFSKHGFSVVPSTLLLGVDPSQESCNIQRAPLTCLDISFPSLYMTLSLMTLPLQLKHLSGPRIWNYIIIDIEYESLLPTSFLTARNARAQFKPRR